MPALLNRHGRSPGSRQVLATPSRAARGDAWTALVRVVEDALADLAEAERRSLRRDRLVSHGYVGGRL